MGLGVGGLFAAYYVFPHFAKRIDALAVAQNVVEQFGRLDVLVNNAGIFGGRRLAETSTEAFDEVMNTNVRGRSSAVGPPLRR